MPPAAVAVGVGGVIGKLLFELAVEHVDVVEHTDPDLFLGLRKGDFGGRLLLFVSLVEEFVLTRKIEVLLLFVGSGEENISRMCLYCGDFCLSPSSSLVSPIFFFG